MPILTGEIVTATRLNHLQPTTYYAIADGTVAASQSNADVPGCSITLTTETDNAVFVAHGSFDFDPTGVPGGLSLGKLNVDGVIQPRTANYQEDATADRASQDKVWRGTLAAAGSHTLKLIATTSTNMTVETHTVLQVTIYEVV